VIIDLTSNVRKFWQVKMVEKQKPSWAVNNLSQYTIK
jgi:hypothetical protein